MKNIALIGGGGFSSEVADIAIQNGFNVLGYTDKIKTASSLKYLGTEDDYFKIHNPEDFIFPSFAAVNRKGLAKRALDLEKYKNLKIPSLVSKFAYVSDSVKIGKGVLVSHGVIINPESDIQDFSIINCRSTIGHNVTISEFSIISGHVFIGGSSFIGSRTLIGPGANIMHATRVGNDVVVSIGACVARKIPDGKTIIPRLSKYI
jgi:sugar O-acyltransferase (sialic acid O-acetyltransferase NeuD family)